MPFTETIPLLRILDEAKAKEFYIDLLGFKIDWGNRASGALFMQVSLDECVLHLSEHRGDACPGAAVKLHTDKIEEYVEQLVAKKYSPGVAEQDPGSQNSPGAVWIWCLSIRSGIGSFLRTQIALFSPALRFTRNDHNAEPGAAPDRGRRAAPGR
jgi:hypothetical protein